MFKIALFTTLLAGALALRLDSEWVEFKTQHSKLYHSPAEEAYRRGVWESNMAYIERHNSAYRRGEVSFWLGQNEFADMTTSEFVKAKNGYRMSQTHGSGQVYLDNDVTALPDEVDWRPKGYVTAVKNQEQCGSCWAFSTTGSLEGQTFRKYGKLTSLSEQNLVDCAKNGNHGCEGGLMDLAFKYIKDNGGIDTEASYPYTGRDGTCKYSADNIGANCTGYVDVKSKDESALQSAVANVGPISVAIDANHVTFQLYEGGVYHNFLCSQTRLDHGVLAVGYGKHEGKDYWLVKNSWGKSWGMEGYIMMSRNRSNNCGIATQASYPTV